MPIPPEFSELEHLQSTVRHYVNKLVREDFKDLDNASGNWDPDITTTRGRMRYALMHKDNDPINVTVTRLLLYYFVYGKATVVDGGIYGIPITAYQESNVFAPQIQLYFDQSRSDVTGSNPRATGEISYRLVGETSQSITEQKALTRANKIKAIFAQPSLYVWKKGKMRLTYCDKENGYDLRINTISEVEGKEVITKVLDIESKTPNWDYLAIHNLANPPSNTPSSKTIYGKVRKLPRRRPTENVKFRYAQLHVWGRPKPVVLVDATLRRGKALVEL